MFKNKSILITGGTGSFGNHLLNHFIKKNNFKKIIIFSRDEYKQNEIENKLDLLIKKKIRFFLGDIRDKNRLKSAFENVDIVIHAAALKQVPAAEYNPIEFIKTNVIGSQNVIECALEKNVSKVLALSTDKACSPINLYGATKLCADKLFIAANNLKGSKKIKFSVLRYGNVESSRGSVIPILKKQSKSGTIFLTDEKMTRFSLSLEQAINFTIESLKNMYGGEIFIPIIPSYRLIDLANAISNKVKIKFIGIRDGEKIHEEMINKADAYNTYKNNKFYVILNKNKKLINYYKKKNFNKVGEDFSYSSNTNKFFLNKAQLKKIIK